MPSRRHTSLTVTSRRSPPARCGSSLGAVSTPGKRSHSTHEGSGLLAALFCGQCLIEVAVRCLLALRLVVIVLSVFGGTNGGVLLPMILLVALAAWAWVLPRQALVPEGIKRRPLWRRSLGGYRHPVAATRRQPGWWL